MVIILNHLPSTENIFSTLCKPGQIVNNCLHLFNYKIQRRYNNRGLYMPFTQATISHKSCILFNYCKHSYTYL